MARDPRMAGRVGAFERASVVRVLHVENVALTRAMTVVTEGGHAPARVGRLRLGP